MLRYGNENRMYILTENEGAMNLVGRLQPEERAPILYQSLRQ